MDFNTFFSKAPARASFSQGLQLYSGPIGHPPSAPNSPTVDQPPLKLRVPGLTFSEKPYFQEIVPSLTKWGQNVLLLGQSNAGKSYFLKQLLSVVKPKRLVVISNTSAKQYQQDGMDLKHYSTMPETIDDA